MEAANWVAIVVSVVGMGGSWYATRVAKSKINAEAKSIDAASVSTYNDVILRQLSYLDEQMQAMRQRTEELETEVRKYQDQIRDAINKEQNLRMQVGKLRAAVRRLREYIVSQGLTPPDVEDVPEDE